MEVVVLTGMSGAGKSMALNYLEDMGYFCIDNLPPQLLPELIKAYTHQRTGGEETSEINRFAFGIDIRSTSLDELIPNLEKISDMGVTYRIIYLEATDQVLINRYKQTRRNHPLAQKHGLSKAIQVERGRLEILRGMASDVIDTTSLPPADLRDKLYEMFSSTDRDERMTILIQSFGFKYGIPADCDCVIDVRFIPNPYYLPELRPLSGLDKPIADYVLGFEETNEYMSRQEGIFEYTIPYYIREGKVRLTIGVGCTGGRHRSVALAEDLAARLRDNNLRVLVDHRDIGKDPRQAKRLEAEAE
jgi:UPF0042 nucleotide-binding protein